MKENVAENQAFFEGTELVIRGKTYIVPGLSLAQVEAHADDIEKLSQMNEKDAFKAMGKLANLLYLAFSRNYPEISLEEFKELIDIRTAPKLFQSVMGESGFEQGQTLPGEAQPVARK